MSEIKSISLQNFRSYSKTEFEFGSATLFLGNNGAGKSNLIEAVYLAATGKSFRADRDDEMIAYNKQFSIINVQCSDVELKVIIGERKKFEVNGVPRRMADFAGKLKAVIFSPQDLDLINGSPSIRRRYLDFVITQKDREYRRCLISYEKGLRQRNKLLEMIRENLASRNQLFFWDKLLIKNGQYLTFMRDAYLANLSDPKYSVTYDKSDISESRLSQYESEEVAAATTLVGPHRDDFVVNLDGRDVSKFGSRGEQRMAVLWLKKSEIAYLSAEGRPVLLLDDIFSELDTNHRIEVGELIKKHITDNGQVIMTSADEVAIHDLAHDYTIYHL